MSMADFARRGFRLTRPAARDVLETHAQSFLTGFNLGVRHWREPHDALAEVPFAERGFAYEGAAMYAALRDLLTAGASGAFDRLLDGPGQGYKHLIHVGAGWIAAPLRLPLPKVPKTPLLRWLALDGAGFGETFFGGLPALERRCARQPRPARVGRWEATVAGCGRALWFVACSDGEAIESIVSAQPEAARPHLWGGVGLACGYAGSVSESEVDSLGRLAGEHLAHLRQGLTWAAGARMLAGPPPEHTELACARLLGTDATTAAGWTSEAATGLTESTDLDAYLTWKARLRDRCTVASPELT